MDIVAKKNASLILFSLLLCGLGLLYFTQTARAQNDKNIETQDVRQEGGKYHARVCAIPNSGDAGCTARVATDQSGKPKTTSSPAAYGPAQFQTAYALPSATAGFDKTIAIVDAYDDPTIKNDLTVYSSQYGLPPCTTDNGCLTIVNQAGGSQLPAPNSGWALEISLDVEIAHAVCPNCSILLVEANSNSLTNLFAAENYAAAHAVAVSNSWGAGEFSGETGYDSNFNHPGVAITVSSGDSGYGTSYPAVSPYVTAVGGTTLALNANNSWKSESAWSGSGSGCSSWETVKPQGQPTLSGCSKRVIADVSADADPNTGAAVYDSYLCSGQCWFKVGGTSLSSPLVAAVYALSGNTTGAANVIPYRVASTTSSYSANFHDVTSGSNGHCGRNVALCSAVPGFDGPTGLGTPNGIGAF
jgi:subtilase family serine protease